MIFGFGKPNIEKMEQKGDVIGLIKALEYKDADIRKNASISLGNLKCNQAIEQLINALKDENGSVRENSAIAIGKIGDISAIDPLMKLLGHSDENIRQSAYIAIARIGTPAIESLLKAIENPNSAIRQNVVEILGIIGDPIAVDSLILRMVNDYDKKVQMKAAESLSKIGWKPGADEAGAQYLIIWGRWDRCVKIGKPALKPLIKVIKNDDEDTRRAAMEALLEIADPDTLEYIIKALNDSRPYVYEKAVDSLDKIGWKPGLDETGAKYWIIKKRWEKCAEIGKPAVKPLIKEIKSDSGEIRRNAILALGRIGDPAAIDYLIKLLNDQEIEVRISAISALGNAGDPQAVEPLIKMLSNKRFAVRDSAATALKMIGTPAINSLIYTFNNNNHNAIIHVAKILNDLYCSENIEENSKNAILPIYDNITNIIKQDTDKRETYKDESYKNSPAHRDSKFLNEKYIEKYCKSRNKNIKISDRFYYCIGSEDCLYGCVFNIHIADVYMSKYGEPRLTGINLSSYIKLMEEMTGRKDRCENIPLPGEI